MFNPKVMTEGDIQTVEFMRGNADMQKRLVQDLASKMIMNEKFVSRYEHLLTTESFSCSPFLPLDLIKKFQHLFDKGLWISKREKSLETLFSPFILDQLSEEEKYSAFHKFNVSRLAGPEGAGITYDSLKGINGIRSVILPLFPEAVADLTTEDMENIDERIFSMSSVSEHLKDKTILEKLIHNKRIMTAQFFFSAVFNCDNIGWQNRMLREADKLNWDVTACTSEIANEVFAKCVEDQVSSICRLMRKYAPNFLSYDSLTLLLRAQELSEETASELFDDFVKKGAGPELKDYCEDREYHAALLKFAVL